MSGLIYLNGILLDAQEAAIPVTDRAYLYGEGLFETMKAVRGVVPFLPEHLDRFFSGFAALDFQPNFSRVELEHGIYQTLRQNHLQEAYLRLQLSRENEAFGSLQGADHYNLMIVVQPLNQEMEKIRQEGIAAVLFPDYKIQTHLLNGVKSTNYAVNLRAKAYAKKQNAQEAIFADPAGNLVEGASSNLFIWNGLAWLTPGIDSGALPGVMRRVLMALMKSHGISLEERPISFQELSQAQEAILTNAIWEIVPLTRWEGRSIGKGQPGEKFRELQKWLSGEISSRISVK